MSKFETGTCLGTGRRANNLATHHIKPHPLMTDEIRNKREGLINFLEKKLLKPPITHSRMTVTFPGLTYSLVSTTGGCAY
jgi:hypothetical protein